MRSLLTLYVKFLSIFDRRKDKISYCGKSKEDVADKVTALLVLAA